MKKMILLMGSGFLLTLSLQAQIHLFLEEQEVGLPDGISNAWVFPITANLEEALDDLKDYCKERSELKLKKGGDNLLIAEKVSLPAIATKRGDLVGYAYITELNYNMALVFQLGYDISLNSSDWASEMESMRNYAKAFMAYHYEQVYARRMKGAEKELKALEKDKGQNENKINSYNGINLFVGGIGPDGHPNPRSGCKIADGCPSGYGIEDFPAQNTSGAAQYGITYLPGYHWRLLSGHIGSHMFNHPINDFFVIVIRQTFFPLFQRVDPCEAYLLHDPHTAIKVKPGMLIIFIIFMGLG